jgi:hypothetical protein
MTFLIQIAALWLAYDTLRLMLDGYHKGDIDLTGYCTGALILVLLLTAHLLVTSFVAFPIE